MDNPTVSSLPPRLSSRRYSLRTRLALGNMIITLLAVMGMGLYVYFRAQQTNTYLTTQLGENVYQRAQDNLTATSNEQSEQLNVFFQFIRRDISSLGETVNRLLSQDVSSAATYWDSAVSLSRLSNGSWDNPNEEDASVFIPAAVNLSDALIRELNILRQMDFFVPSLLRANPDVVALYFGGASGETIYYPNIDLSAIVPPDFDVTQRPWFLNVRPVQNPDRLQGWSAPYLDAALNGLVITISTPVYDDDGRFLGVTAMDIQLNQITEIVTNIQVGQTGFAFLLDQDFRLIAMPAPGYSAFGITTETLPLGELFTQEKITANMAPDFWNIVADMASGKSGLTTTTISGVEHFIVYQPVPEVDYSLAIVVPTQELLAEVITAEAQISQITQNAILVSVLIVVIILVFALSATLIIGNRLTRPLVSLTRVAEEMAGGNLNTVAPVLSLDETGILADSFNKMTARLRDMIENLEGRVSERTLALERRALQVQAAAEVGNAAASFRNLDDLLTRVTHLISRRFGYYHVGIFLLDDREEFALLAATNSAGGQAMLARGHKLKVGQVGIVGYVTSTGNTRIALDVGEDAEFFNNPDLPETRSEMALPLKISNRIMGALDVQSTEENAFSNEDAQTIRILADQLAIAIENARLFTENQKNIEAARRAYGDISRTQWDSLFKEKGTNQGVAILSRGQVVPATNQADPNYQEALKGEYPILTPDGTKLYMPVKVLGNSIGVIGLSKKSNSRWSQEDIQAVSSLSEQLGNALEGARLYEQISERATRESLVTEISAKIGSSIELDTIIHTTVEEIGKLFQDSEITLQLKKEVDK